MKITCKRLFFSCGVLLVLVTIYLAMYRANLPEAPAEPHEVVVTNLRVQIVHEQSPPFTPLAAAPIYVRTHNRLLPLIGDTLTVRREMHDSARFIKVDGLPSQHHNYILQICSGAHITPTPLFPRDDYYITGPVLFCIAEALPSPARLTLAVCDNGNKVIEFQVCERVTSR